jgi:hypothetical protein
MLGVLPTPHMQSELRAFAHFLHTIATKGLREDVPLAFSGTKLRVAVVLVARSDVIRQYGITPYVRRIINSVRNRHELIYVAAWGQEYAQAVIDIQQEIHKSIVIVLHRFSVAGLGVLLVCQSQARFIVHQRELEKEVQEALGEIVPEVKAGQVEVVSIARIPGSGCKIAVRMATDEDPRRSAAAFV